MSLVWKKTTCKLLELTLRQFFLPPILASLNLWSNFKNGEQKHM